MLIFELNLKSPVDATQPDAVLVALDIPAPETGGNVIGLVKQ